MAIRVATMARSHVELRLSKFEVFILYTMSAGVQLNSCPTNTESTIDRQYALKLFESNLGSLTSEQLSRIIEIITSQNNIAIANIDKQDRNETYETNQSPEWEYTFEEDNTCLSLLCQKKCGKRLSETIYSRNGRIFICSLMVLIVVVDIVRKILYMNNLKEPLSLFVIAMISLIVFLSYLVTIILTVNVHAIKLISTTFEFYFKLYYVLQYIVANFIILYVNPNSGGIYHPDKHYYIIYEVFEVMTIFCVVFMIGILDGLQFRFTVKVTLCVMAAMVFTYQGMDSRIRIYRDPSQDNKINIYNWEISMTSLMIDSMQIMAIFFWKQAILTMKFRKKPRCTLIKYAPYIQWEKSWSHKICVNNNSNDNISLSVDIEARLYQEIETPEINTDGIQHKLENSDIKMCDSDLEHLEDSHESEQHQL